MRTSDGELIEYINGIAFTKDSFRKHGGIKPSLAFMFLGDGLKDLGRFLRRIRIERDHHATAVQFGNAHQDVRAEAQRSTDEVVFGKAGGVRKVEINVGAELTLIDWHSGFPLKLTDGLKGEQGQRRAIGHGTVGPEQRDAIGRLNSGAKEINQRWIVDFQKLSVGHFHVDRQLRGTCGKRPRSVFFRFPLIAWACGFHWIAKPRPIANHAALVAAGEVRKSFWTRIADKGKKPIAINAGVADEEFLHLFATHTFDRITPEAIDFSDDRHDPITTEAPAARQRKSAMHRPEVARLRIAEMAARGSRAYRRWRGGSRLRWVG